jgi:hypothetical protein
MLHRLQHDQTDKICRAVDCVTFFWALAIQYVLNPHPIPYMIADICPFSVLKSTPSTVHILFCLLCNYSSTLALHLPRLLLLQTAWGTGLAQSLKVVSLDTDQCLAHFCRIIMGQIQVSSCGGWPILYCLWWRPHDCAARCKWARGAIDEVSTLAAAAATVCCVRGWGIDGLAVSVVLSAESFLLLLLFFFWRTSQYGVV